MAEDMLKTSPVLSSDHGVSSGQVFLHGRPLKYVTNSQGGKLFLVQDVRDVFFVTEQWLRKRLEELKIQCTITSREQTASLRESGLVSGNTSRVSAFPEEALEKILADVPVQPYISTTAQTVREKSSVSDDAATTLKIKRLQAMLRSDLVGRDVNCIQNPVAPQSETKLASSLSRSPESEDVTTRTRIVKRPQRLCDYDQQNSASDSNDGDWPASKRKRLDLGGSPSSSQTAAVVTTPTSDSGAGLGSRQSSQQVSPNSALVMKFQRQYSPEHEGMRWVVPPHGSAAMVEYNAKRFSQLSAPSRDHGHTGFLDKSCNRAVDDRLSSASSQNVSAERAPVSKSKTSKSRVGGSTKTKASKSVSGTPSSRPQSQASNGTNGSHSNPPAFSLSTAIPETRPRLAVRDNQLVEAVSYSAFLGAEQLPPPDHPVWTWKVGTPVRKEHYALHFVAT